MASLWKLPVIYVLENNNYGEYTSAEHSTAGSAVGRAEAMNIPTRKVDGNDVLAVRTAAAVGGGARTRRGGTQLHRVCHLSLARPPHGRPGRYLWVSHPGRNRDVDGALPDPAPAWPAVGGWPGGRRSSWTPSRPTCSRKSTAQLNLPNKRLSRIRLRCSPMSTHERIGTIRDAINEALCEEMLRDPNCHPARRGCGSGRRRVQGHQRAARTVWPGPCDRYADFRGRHHWDCSGRSDDRPAARWSKSCSPISRPWLPTRLSTRRPSCVI